MLPSQTKISRARPPLPMRWMLRREVHSRVQSQHTDVGPGSAFFWANTFKIFTCCAMEWCRGWIRFRVFLRAESTSLGSQLEALLRFYSFREKELKTVNRMSHYKFNNTLTLEYASVMIPMVKFMTTKNIIITNDHQKTIPANNSHSLSWRRLSAGWSAPMRTLKHEFMEAPIVRYCRS